MMQTIPYELAKLMSEAHPLRGKRAGDALRKTLDGMGTLAEEEGLTEDDIAEMTQARDNTNDGACEAL